MMWIAFRDQTQTHDVLLKSLQRMKTYRNIHYSYMPASYWGDNDVLSAILRNVKGESRRELIADYYRRGRLDELSAELIAEEVGDPLRRRLGQIHPSVMGGEYLPGYLPGEVEIVRISLQSTTSDVISLRASPVWRGISYRVVDEYGAKFSLPITQSETTLTLKEIIHQLDEGRLDDMGFPYCGLALGYNELNAEFSAREELRNFTTITSDFYPQLYDHYERVFDDWVAGRI